jgi:hypothetical protein
MHYYETVTQAVAELSKRGYNVNFNLSMGHLSWIEQGVNLKPEEFNIDEVYRFEGETDPGDEMVIYAISSDTKGIKGILVNAFGPYADQISDDLMAKLKQSHS